MKFYLGSPEPSWLNFSTVPLFVSRRRFIKIRHTLPRAMTPWALDSGGFTELSQYGRWLTTPQQYLTDARRYRDEVGLMDWAAPQDWMVEDAMLAKTGLTIADHQRLTIENYLTLHGMDAAFPIVPVIQGQTLGDYLRHVDAYAAAGIDLTAEPTVGIGSVCRRQATDEIEGIVRGITAHGLRLHGFGMKTLGLAKIGRLMHSSDSMAWSYRARQGQIRLPGCTHKGKCTYCYRWATQWRERMLTGLEMGVEA